MWYWNVYAFIMTMSLRVSVLTVHVCVCLYLCVSIYFHLRVTNIKRDVYFIHNAVHACIHGSSAVCYLLFVLKLYIHAREILFLFRCLCFSSLNLLHLCALECIILESGINDEKWVPIYSSGNDSDRNRSSNNNTQQHSTITPNNKSVSIKIADCVCTVRVYTSYIYI